jgi:hypothetical protein
VIALSHAFALLDRVLQLCMHPFELKSPWPGLVATGIFVALPALLAFKCLSNQRALRRARGVMLARLTELHIYRHDPIVILRSFGRTVAAAAVYSLKAAPPVLTLAVPLALILPRLDGWFGRRPFRAGEDALVTVQLNRGVPFAETAHVLPPPGVSVTSQPFASESANQIIWRIRIESLSGESALHISIGGKRYEKSIVADERMRFVSPERSRIGLRLILNSSAEPPLPSDAPISAISIEYPERYVEAGSFRLNWIVALFALSVASGLILRRPLRVEL